MIHQLKTMRIVEYHMLLQLAEYDVTAWFNRSILWTIELNLLFGLIQVYLSIFFCLLNQSSSKVEASTFNEIFE